MKGERLATQQLAERKTYSANCPDCGKQVRVRPAGGDWLNALYVIRHKAPNGKRCFGHFHELKTRDLIEPKRQAPKVVVTITRAGKCKGCGYKISPDSEFCGECICEEDSL
jgi:hypothetical protein